MTEKPKKKKSKETKEIKKPATLEGLTRDFINSNLKLLDEQRLQIVKNHISTLEKIDDTVAVFKLLDFTFQKHEEIIKK